MQTLYPSLISRLETQHQVIEIIISSIDVSRIAIRPQPSKWNIHENIAHLVRYQQVFLDRLNIILNNDKPFIGRYVAEEDVAFENFKAKKPLHLNKELRQNGKAVAEYIKSLSEKELIKVGIHKKFGALNIIQWTEFFLLHEAHHIYTIFQLAHDVELINKGNKNDDN